MAVGDAVLSLSLPLSLHVVKHTCLNKGFSILHTRMLGDPHICVSEDERTEHQREGRAESTAK